MVNKYIKKLDLSSKNLNNLNNLQIIYTILKIKI